MQRFQRVLGPSFTFIVICVALVVATLRTTAESPQAPADSYYFDARPVSLTRSDTEVVVRFAGGVGAVNRLLDRTPDLQQVFGVSADGNRYEVLSVPAPLTVKGSTPPGGARPAGEAVSQLLESLRLDPEVDFVAPMFHYPATGIRVLLTDELVVRMRAGDSAQDLAGFVAGYGLTVDRALDGAPDQFVLRMTDGKGPNALEISRALYDSGRVEWAEPNFMQEYQKFDTPDDPLFSSQWHLKNTGQSGGTVGADSKLDQAWDLETGDGSIVVAVVDDGMELAHEDLAATVYVNLGEIPANGIDDDSNGKIDDVSGWDFSNGDNDVNPTSASDNHGTSVAGVAAARGNNTIGVSGACRNCRVLPVKMFEGAFATTSSNIANALTYAALFADVINNSWGGGSPSATIQAAIATANTTGRGGKGAVVMFATGNSASGFSTYTITGFPPGSYGFQFEYLKDASVSAGDDTAWVAWTQFPGGAIQEFTSGIPAGWTTGGAVGWSVVTDPTHTDEGVCLTKAAKAGTIGDSQSSTMQVLNKAVGAGNWVTYFWRSSELNSDGFRVNVDTDNNGTFDFTTPLSTGVPFVTMGVAYPAAHPESIAVGASSNFDCRSHYSQFGPELAFVAPSSAGPRNLRIVTTDRTGAAGYDAASNYTTSFGGTSSATPLASGIAALVLSKNPNLTRAEVLGILKNSADQVGPEPYVGGRNDRYGDGRLNAYQALLDTPLPPGPFGHTSPANGATGQSLSPTLMWGASSNATSYEYCYDTTNNSACDSSWVSVGGATSVGLGGLSASTTYYWHVRANNTDGTTYAEGNPATFWSFTTQGAPPPPPGAFSFISPANAATGQSLNPTLTWGASAGATSYEYCYDTINNSACDASWVSVGTATNVGLSGLMAGTTHYWHVRALNGGGTTYAGGSMTAFRRFVTIDLLPFAVGQGPFGGNGGWFQVKRGKAEGFAGAGWHQVPWGAYNASGGPVHPAFGDVDGDGRDEIVLGLGPGGAGWIAVLDDAENNYALLKWIQIKWVAYNNANGEVYPAVADLDGDNKAEIVAGLGPGGAGWIEIFEDASLNYAHAAWKQVAWPAYNTGPAPTHPAAADVDGDGKAEIVIGLGADGAGWLEVLDDAATAYAHKAWLQVKWPAYNGANGTTYPAAGDVDNDGKAEIVVGLGAGGQGWVEVFNDALAAYGHLAWLQVSWGAYNTSPGEVHPAVGNLDNDAGAEIVFGLASFPGNGGWIEIRDDSSQGYASLGWSNLNWAAFKAAGGATWPAIGRWP